MTLGGDQLLKSRTHAWVAAHGDIHAFPGLNIIATAKSKSCEILLPLDGVVAREFKAGSPHRVVDIADVKADDMILDAGPRSVAAIKAAFDKARTLVWNGPLGAFELKPFDVATNEAARHAAALTKAGKLVSEP